jgi:hypothetical protein
VLDLDPISRLLDRGPDLRDAFAEESYALHLGAAAFTSSAIRSTIPWRVWMVRRAASRVRGLAAPAPSTFVADIPRGMYLRGTLRPVHS